MDPVSYSLTLVKTDEKSRPFPAFAMQYSSDKDLENVSGIEVVRLNMEPLEEGRAQILVTGISHVQCDCAPVTRVFKFAASQNAISGFFNAAARAKGFLWIVSTPSFEIRSLVDLTKNRITEKSATERTLH